MTQVLPALCTHLRILPLYTVKVGVVVFFTFRWANLYFSVPFFFLIPKQPPEEQEQATTRSKKPKQLPGCVTWKFSKISQFTQQAGTASTFLMGLCNFHPFLLYTQSNENLDSNHRRNYIRPLSLTPLSSCIHLDRESMCSEYNRVLGKNNTLFSPRE